MIGSDPDATARWEALDKAHIWHPFTPMGPWLDPDHHPLVIVGGDGPWLFDSQGRRYLDGNSSIWTNLHGHGHPTLVAALATQAARLDHASFLGTTNPPAIELAARLAAFFPPHTLDRVFFTDDGSTAIECALKVAIQYHQLVGSTQRQQIAAFANAYHGDTLGAASMGGVDAFVSRFRRYGFDPLRLASADELLSLPAAGADSLAAVFLEPMIQGVNRMALWPSGMLSAVRSWCDAQGVLLVLDEVMTGFGRTGRMFACQHEEVVPDLLCLAKGLTGGTVPLAATMVSSRVFSAFLDQPSDTPGLDRTFYYGHSYAGNPTGCAAALASLDVFREERVLDLLPPKIAALEAGLHAFHANHPMHVSSTRQCGLIGAIDIVADSESGRPFAQCLRAGHAVCHHARAFGLLTRPISDTLVFMPPLCTPPEAILAGLEALSRGLDAALPALLAAENGEQGRERL